MEGQLSQPDFLSTMQSEYNRLESVIDSLRSEQLTQPGAYADSDWTVKDTLAHIAAWARRTVSRLPGRSRLGDPITMEQGEAWEHYMDRLNDAYYRESRNTSWDDVRADYAAAYAEIRSAIEALSNEELSDPDTYEMLVGNTWGHYREHLEVLDRWLGKT